MTHATCPAGVTPALTMPRFADHWRLVSRRLRAGAIAYVPERFGLIEGLRAATAVAIMVGASLLVHQPTLSWGAFAAFWTCLADPDGPDRTRLVTMGGFVVLGTVLAPLMVLLAGCGPTTATLALFAIVASNALLSRFGAAAAQVGMLANVVVVVAIDQPLATTDPAMLGGAFLTGGVFALLLCLVIWRTHPRDSAAQNAAAIVRDLRDMTGDLHALALHGVRPDRQHRRALRATLERARVDMAMADPDLAALADAAEHILAGLIALDHAMVERARDWPGASVRAMLETLDDALSTMGRGLTRRNWAHAGVGAHVQTLRDLGRATPGLPSRVAALWADALCTRSSRPHRRSSPAAMVAPIRGIAVPGHALRLAVMVTITQIVTQGLHLGFAYWATMAIVVVMQPDVMATWPRMIERVVGSMVGGCAAGLLTSVCTDAWQLVAMVFPLAAATIALRRVNYTLYVVFLTPLFVAVADLTAAHAATGYGIALARTGTNVLGSVLGLAGSLCLSSQRPGGMLARALSAAVAANLHYARLTLDATVAFDQREHARREAERASAVAEARCLSIIGAACLPRPAYRQAEALLRHLRYLAGATTIASVERGHQAC